jgi:hypothetical protein
MEMIEIIGSMFSMKDETSLSFRKNYPQKKQLKQWTYNLVETRLKKMVSCGNPKGLKIDNPS